MRRILIGWLPVVGLCAAIFIQSCFATPDLGPSFPFQDKFLHMAAYATLAALFYRACRLTWPDRFSPSTLLVASIIFASLYGLSDEFHQSFVGARQADMGDWIADGVGSILGAGVYLLIKERGVGRRNLG